MAFDRGSFRLSVFQIVGFLLVLSGSAQGQTIKFIERPGSIYTVEGETASVSCIAGGPIGKIEFWRKDTSGIIFVKITNTDRVYVTSKTEGNTTKAVLHFKNVQQSDESVMSGRRYSCRVFNKTNAMVYAHDFPVNVIKFSDLPTAYPNSTVVLNKTVGEPQQITCNITYQPTSIAIQLRAMYWIKHGVVIDKVDARKGKFDKDLDSLKFDKLSVGDAGTYACILRTSLNRVRDYNVTGGPFILNICEHPKCSSGGSRIKQNFFLVFSVVLQVRNLWNFV